MNLKIVNIKKFIVSLMIIMSVVLLLLFIGFSNVYSKGEIKYKNEYISYGDTLWEIAIKESKENKYFEDADIRSIVSKIKNINNIRNQNLEVGQKIIIPTL